MPHLKHAYLILVELKSLIGYKYIIVLISKTIIQNFLFRKEMTVDDGTVDMR